MASPRFLRTPQVEFPQPFLALDSCFSDSGRPVYSLPSYVSSLFPPAALPTSPKPFSLSLPRTPTGVESEEWLRAQKTPTALLRRTNSLRLNIKHHSPQVPAGFSPTGTFSLAVSLTHRCLLFFSRPFLLHLFLFPSSRPIKPFSSRTSKGRGLCSPQFIKQSSFIFSHCPPSPAQSQPF